MTARDDSASLENADRTLEPPDARFQLASAAYGGVFLAGVAALVVAAVDAAPIGLAPAYAVGFALGCVGGALLARIDRRLPVRLGRTTTRRLGFIVPGVGFLVLWLAPLEAPAGDVAITSAILVFATGYALSQLAGNRYVETVTTGDPDETWRWEPPGSFRLDAALFVLYVALGTGNAVSGNWLWALVWLALGVGWIASCLLEGRWAFGPGRDRCEIQFYENGLVKRRPYTKTFVPWERVNHTRLRDDELVLDYGLRDVRFGREELEDPDAVLESVDRRLAHSANR